YGPGSLWVLAAAFKVLGHSLITERLVGLAQQVGIVLALFFLARPWGRAVATVTAVVGAVIIIPPIGLTALAWVGAVALGLAALACGLEARRRLEPPSASLRRWLVASGVLAGLALLYRPDLIVAVAAGLAVVNAR